MENSMLQRQEAEKKSAGNSAVQLAKMMGNQAAVSLVIQRSGKPPDEASPDDLRLLLKVLSEIGVTDARRLLFRDAELSVNWPENAEEISQNRFDTDSLKAIAKILTTKTLSEAREVENICTTRFLRRHLLGLWLDEEGAPDVVTKDFINRVYDEYEAYDPWDDNNDSIVLDGYRLMLWKGEICHLENASKFA